MPFSNTIWLPSPRDESLPQPRTHPFLRVDFGHEWLSTGFNPEVHSPGKQSHAGIWQILSLVAEHGRGYYGRKLTETTLAIYFDRLSIKCMTVNVYSNIIFNNREPFIFLLTKSRGRNYMTLVFQRGCPVFLLFLSWGSMTSMQTVPILKSGRTGFESMLQHQAVRITFMNLSLKSNIMANYTM